MIYYDVYSKWMCDPQVWEGSFNDEARAEKLKQQLSEENDPVLYTVFIKVKELCNDKTIIG